MLLQRNCHPSIPLNKKESTSKATTSEQTTLDCLSEKKYSANDPRQLRISSALLSFAAEDLMPLSIIESSGFRAFVHSLDPRYQVPSRKQFSSVLLGQRYTKLFTNVKNSLQNVTGLSITMDLWTNRQMRSFTGITGHYILDSQLKSVLLCCKRFKGCHTAENIYQQYEDAVLQFDVADKVRHIVTDTASNMVKAFKLPGYEIENEEEDNTDSELECLEYDESDYLSEGKVECVQSSEPEFSTYLDGLPAEHHGCFAHVLQLVVKDGFKRVPQIDKIIRKCSKIVSHVRKSTIAKDHLEGEKVLQIANATHWNLQLKMLRSIVAVPSEKLDSLDTQKLTAYERSVIKEIIEILTPFEEATDYAQIENYPSAGYVLPCIRGLEDQLNKMVTKYYSSFIKALQKSLSTRMRVYEKKDDYLLTAVLDPRFKLLWCKDNNEKSKVKIILTSKLTTITCPSATNETNEEPTAPSESDTQPPKKKRKIFHLWIKIVKGNQLKQALLTISKS